MYMNNNQRTFAQEYVKNGNNGTRAYMKAYPDCTEETARINASRLLTNANVKEYIKELQNEVRKETIMSAKERMEWLTKVITGEIDEKIYMSDKLKSMDILNKMDGNYVTKLEGNIGITSIEVDIDE